MYVIGLTGGIGSGKTAASDYFASLGVTIVDADLAARVIVEPGKPALEQIRQHFGAAMLNADGTLNRAALRQLVFSDKKALQDLEAITHPAIRSELLRQIQASTSAYTILVSPLLFETDQSTLVQRVLLVDVPESVQLARTVERDGVPASQVESIMAAQMQREQRRLQADDIVVNDGSLEHLHQQLDTLHRKYLQLAQ